MAANLPRYSTILLATTDEVLTLHLIPAIIKAGFKVVHTMNGNEAVLFSMEQPEIGILILDTSIPGLNGYEVTRMIRKSGNMDLVIILLAWFSVQSLEMANAVGCDELVAKVVNVQELMEVIGKWSGVEVEHEENVTRDT